MMARLYTYSVSRTILAFLFITTSIFPASAYYCSFDDTGCIDGLAQVSISFNFESISPYHLRFYYAFDGGFSYLNGTPSIKVGYWLQYDQDLLADYNKHTQGTNWTTEAALRIGNLNGFVGGPNNGCDGVWGSSCSENLKSFLQSSIFNLSQSGVPYDLPLQTVLQPLTDNSLGPYIEGCPSSLFDLRDIPSYAFINKTAVNGSNISNTVSVASSGSQSLPWQTWYVSDVTPMQQAQEVAVGIISSGPIYESNPLTSPDDIQLELVCSRAPRQGPPPNPDFSAVHGFARGFINTYAFDDDSLDYEDELHADEYNGEDYGENVDDNVDEDDEDEYDLDADDFVKCSGSNT